MTSNEDYRTADRPKIHQNKGWSCKDIVYLGKDVVLSFMLVTDEEYVVFTKRLIIFTMIAV